jgi:hypothetical protein
MPDLNSFASFVLTRLTELPKCPEWNSAPEAATDAAADAVGEYLLVVMTF